MTMLQRYIPGFERCTFLDTSPYIGVRETRRVFADHFLTEDEILTGKRFSDTIGLGGYYLDVHPPGGQDKPLSSMQYRLDTYELPYAMLLPKNVDGLLAAGRCMSASQRAFGAIRVIATCMVMGQACGTAAALAVETDRLPRDVETAVLQERLQDAGVFIHPEQSDSSFEFATVKPQ